ncbi:MAG: hypothetical protein PHU27_07710 [Salinivirgaceae bacterium]|nr:hypothetical protein [Salinivirgaceae bacterium]
MPKEITYTTVEEGIKKLRERVNIRDQMGGALYWNVFNDECMCLGDRLIDDGADGNLIAEIGGWKLRNEN